MLSCPDRSVGVHAIKKLVVTGESGVGTPAEVTETGWRIPDYSRDQGDPSSMSIRGYEGQVMLKPYVKSRDEWYS